METTNQEKLSQVLIEFYEKMSSWEHAVVKESGLSPAQMHTIEMIGHHEYLKMKALAEKMGISTGTLTVMIDRLEKNKLVTRQPHESDRRSYIIALTKNGHKYFREHHQRHSDLTRDITSSLDGEDVDRLTGILEKIIKNM